MNRRPGAFEVPSVLIALAVARRARGEAPSPLPFAWLHRLESRVFKRHTCWKRALRAIWKALSSERSFNVAALLRRTWRITR